MIGLIGFLERVFKSIRVTVNAEVILYDHTVDIFSVTNVSWMIYELIERRILLTTS